MILRVTATHIFPNCPRYIHKMQVVEHSVYAPRPNYTPPVPAWNTFAAFRDALSPLAIEATPMIDPSPDGERPSERQAKIRRRLLLQGIGVGVAHTIVAISAGASMPSAAAGTDTATDREEPA
jgi:hypothetical protein